MFILYIYCVILTNLFPVKGVQIEDLENAFGLKHCIEDSLVSLPSNQDTSIHLDSLHLRNVKNFETTLEKFDKTATSKINELAQFNDITYVYKLLSEEGLAHAKTFTVNLVLGDENYKGSGPSLKKAQQAAAASALEFTSYEHPTEKKKIGENKSLTPTVALNNIATKLAIPVSYHLLNGKEEQIIDEYGGPDSAYGKSKNYFSKLNSSSDPLRVPVEEPQIVGPFTVKVQVGDFIFKGLGHSVQAARHDAALKAIQAMEKQALLKDNVCTIDDSLQECKSKKESLKSPISRVYEAAQKQGLLVEFNLISDSGKSHKKTFVTQCKLGNYVTEGEGSSKKDSKRLAAEKMLQYLPQLDNFYGENMIVNSFSKKKKKSKKNKILKTNNDNLVQSVSAIVSSMWSSDDTSSKGKQKTTQKTFATSAKEKLLEIGSSLNVPIDFTDLSSYKGNFYSIVSLAVRPSYICLGKALTREKSHELAAMYGINFLQKAGLYGKVEVSKYHLSDEFENEYDLDEDLTIISLENSKQKDEL